MKARFIVLEGIEGVGKSTQIPLLAEWLKQCGCRVTLTREPGGTALGEEIRALLLSRRQEGMCPDSEMLLMFAARSEHLSKVVKPRLSAGHWVLCDRFTDATYAYQGGGRDQDASRIATLEHWTQGDLRPDLVVLLDLAVEDGLARAGRRGESDRFESERRDFFERARAVYLGRASARPDRYRVVDASGDVAEVQCRLRKAVAHGLGVPWE